MGVTAFNAVLWEHTTAVWCARVCLVAMWLWAEKLQKSLCRWAEWDSGCVGALGGRRGGCQGSRSPFSTAKWVIKDKAELSRKAFEIKMGSLFDLINRAQQRDARWEAIPCLRCWQRFVLWLCGEPKAQHTSGLGWRKNGLPTPALAASFCGSFWGNAGSLGAFSWLENKMALQPSVNAPSSKNAPFLPKERFPEFRE